MRNIFCPRCHAFSLEQITEDFYKCDACGYEGSVGMEKSFIKKV